MARYFPLEGHFNAQRAARAVETASQQDQFEAMYHQCHPVVRADHDLAAGGVVRVPDPLLGIAGYGGARLAGWYWAGLQVGVTAGVVFVGCWSATTMQYGHRAPMTNSD